MLKLLPGTCARARFASARAADSAAFSGASRPFEEIPSSKMSLTKTALVMFDLIRGKPPDLARLMKSNQQAYGNIFNVSFGPLPMTVVLRPEDVEAMFRIDGKVPIRDAMAIWVDAMKSLGRDLTLFHRLVVSEKTLLHSAEITGSHTNLCVVSRLAYIASMTVSQCMYILDSVTWLTFL